MRFGVYDARGYDYPIERRFDRLWRTTVAPITLRCRHTVRAQVNERSLRTLGLLGVASVIQQPEDPPRTAPACSSSTTGRTHASSKSRGHAARLAGRARSRS